MSYLLSSVLCVAGFVLVLGCSETSTDAVSQQPKAPSGNSNSKADDPNANRGSQGSIVFEEGFSEPVASNLVAGGQAIVRYAPSRFDRIIDWSTGTGQYLESTHHCYGYGCCELSYPDLQAMVRFDSAAAFEPHALSETGEVTLSVPSDASTLEVYFESKGYDIRTWYCGCDKSCSDQNYQAATPTHRDLPTFDSRFGANYVFAVAPQAERPQVIFSGDLSAAPSLTSAISAGDSVRVIYPAERLKGILGDQTLRSAHHCYGYGCCELQFPAAFAHYRTHSYDEWTDVAMDASGSFDITLADDAELLEIWFHTESYDIKTWYCGCDEACASEQYNHAAFSTVNRKIYDSNFAQNFVFAVSP